MKDFLKTQKLNMMPLSQFTRAYIRANINNPQAIMFWVTPGYLRMKRFLEANGFSIGTKGGESVILSGHIDPELLFLDTLPRGTAKQQTDTQNYKQRAGAWNYEATAS